jgi:sulfite reductase beta subunit-like hemoprotein
MVAIGETVSIIPVVEAEIDAFEEEAAAFRRGERGEEFVSFRLHEGVYGQRQMDAQMIRVKVPGGLLTAEALDALGTYAEQFAPLKKGHITTRENIQFHHVKLEDAGPGKRLLGRVGLTGREACANTVRNVIASPLAGVDKNDIFDVMPYLAAYVRFFVRKPFTHNMPRKFKTSFSGDAADSAVAPYHDLGFVAAERTVDGATQRGFKMYVGGGSSVMPRAALPLYDFVPLDEYLKVSEAVLRVFNRSDELRKNRMKARIKYLVERIGIDGVRKEVEFELTQPWAQQGSWDPTPYLLTDYEPIPTTPADSPTTNGHGNELEVLPEKYLRWRRTNVVEQRQPGFAAVTATIPLGDITHEQFHQLAGLARSYGNGHTRTTWEQNLVFRWIPIGKVYQFWQELAAIGFGEPGANEIEDVTSCPGTDSCKLGITGSMQLGRVLERELREAAYEDPLVQKMHVKISGCPNGCGRHHLANIGFQGAALKSEDDRQVPAYEVYVGGHYENGQFRYAQRVATRVPAKRTPEAVRRFVAFYLEDREDGELFNDFVDRVGPKPFVELVEDLRPVGPLSNETVEMFVDWGRDEIYQVIRGEGECAAG